VEWLATKITRNAWAVVIAVGIVTAGAAYKASHIRFAFSLRELFEYKGNKDVPLLNSYLAEFGDDGGFVGVIIEHDNIFSPPVLRYIKEISHAIEAEPIFWRAKSLSLVQVPRASGEDVVTGRLFEQVPEDPRELAAIRKVALESQLIVPRLLSPDGKYTVVAAEMKTPSCVASIEEQDKAVAIVQGLVKKLKSPEGARVLVGGPPVIEAEIRRILVSDQLLFAGVACGLMLVVLWLAFGNLHGVLLPFSNAIIYMVWTVGLMAIGGERINIITNTLPTVLLTYGLLDALFMVSAFYDLIDEGHPPKEASRLAVMRVGWPCFLCSATTALGFASFYTCTVPLFKFFGLYAAAGILFALFANLVWLPALLAAVPPPRRGYRKRKVLEGVGRLAAIINGLVKRHRWAIAATLVVAVLGCIGIYLKWSRIDVYYLKELPANTESMKVNRLLSEKLSGVIRTAVTINGKPDSMLEPAAVRAIDELDRWAEKHSSLVRSSLSIADVVRAMHQAFNGGDPRYYDIPKTKSLISQYLSLLDPDNRSDFLRTDFSGTHLRILSADVGSHDWRKFYVELRKEAERLLGKFAAIDFTGYAKTSYTAQELAVREMVAGFLIAFFIIDLLIMIGFRSVRLGLIAILPNLLPTVACMAILAIGGITLRVGTALFLSVSVGMVFDNTIQLIAAVRRARAAGADVEEAYQQAYHAVAPPAIFSAALIACGFGIFVLSDFEILKAFGMLCVGVILFGLLADLFGTVSLLRIFARPCFPAPQSAAEAVPSSANKNGGKP
jgi:predicted RND superfamily exporter protein